LQLTCVLQRFAGANGGTHRPAGADLSARRSLDNGVTNLLKLMRCMQLPNHT